MPAWREAVLLTVEYLELLVDLDELEGAAGPPPLLLGQPVVDVALVLGAPAHPA